MNTYARALLKAAYGSIVPVEDGGTLPDGASPSDAPKPDVFNAVVTWIRTDAGMEPLVAQKSGLESMAEKMRRKK